MSDADDSPVERIRKKWAPVPIRPREGEYVELPRDGADSVRRALDLAGEGAVVALLDEKGERWGTVSVPAGPDEDWKDAQKDVATLLAEIDSMRSDRGAREAIDDIADKMFGWAIDERDVRHQLVDHRTDGAELARAYAQCLRVVRDRIDAFYGPIVDAMERRAEEETR